MDAEDRKETRDISELVVRRYFENYLTNVWPRQLAEVIGAHNKDVAAHAQQIREAVNAETSRFKLWFIGLLIFGGGVSGAGIARFVTFLTRP